jgi:predicted GH43/DUF377 family glycosyl hydrolase
LSHDFIGFAQSPQTIVFDDFVRIYFSIRKSDKNNKYVSYIQYVDFEYDMRTIKKVSSHEVFGPGKIGCFDEHGIFPMNVLKVGDKIFAYTNGWTRRVSVSVDTGIGFAISLNQGESFERIGDGPIMASTSFEPVLVGDPFVKLYNGVFHMWYIFGVRWIDSNLEEPQRVYKIGHAVSTDGINCAKEEARQIIPDCLNIDECQALPTILFHKNRYHMYFCYREATGFRKDKTRGYRLGYAYSDDLKNWTRDEDNVGIKFSEEGWDSEMMCYPHIFKCDNKVYLMYNGNAFGKHGFGIAVLEE